MADLDKIRARLIALRAKTLENGCTEAEAIAAAEKAAELMDSHQLSEADLELLEVAELTVALGARRTPIDSIWKIVAVFANCSSLFRRSGNRWSYAYIGRGSDVLIAEYVHEVIRRAADRAIVDFRKSDEYQKRRKPKTRAVAMRAFLEGFALSISGKLLQGLWRRYPGTTPEEATRLIQAKAAGALARLGIAVKPVPSIARAKGQLSRAAHAKGWHAGQPLSVEAGVADQSVSPIAGLLT